MSSRNTRARTRTASPLVAIGTVIAVAATALLGTTAAAAPPEPDHGIPVHGRSAADLAAAKNPASSTSVAPVRATLPGPGRYDVAIPSHVTAHPRTTKSGGKEAATTAGDWHDVGSTGIQVAAAQAGGQAVAAKTKGTVRADVTRVTAEVVDAATAKKHGLKGLVLALSRADSGTAGAPVAVRIPRAMLDSVYGADYGSRVEWRQLDGEASGEKAKSAEVPAARDADGATLLTPTLSARSVLLAATATPVSASGTGSFTATSLKPSSAWDVSAQTGDFSWSYPLSVPPAPAGPAPQLSFSYDSQSVDGETGSTNNQPSVVGEGWSLAGAGFIERTYVSCATDNGASGPVTTSGDLCWKTDNATISFAGHSGQIIRDATSGTWRLQSDDGTRFEHLVGTAAGCAANGTYDTDCWRMTTTDGTTYYFGLNQLPGFASGKPTTNSAWTVPVYGNDAGEPCHGATFAASSCTQAWRWNLDYIVDVHGNAEAFYYNAQTNKYTANNTTVTGYTRGGELDHIDYGFTTGNAYAANAASGRVQLGYDPYGRCSDASHANCTAQPLSGAATAPAHPTAYPDVPFDQSCTAATCPGLISPTFWTTSMLSTVTTKALVAGSYATVDVWTLGHSFPDPGDATAAALWLTKIDHTGYSGSTSLAEPTTTFGGLTMQNRVWVVDGLAPLDKYRITSIQTSLGGLLSVSYSSQQCTPANAAAIEAAPQSNTNRCFPQWWTPKITPPQAAQKDLFHKYVVTTVMADPKTGGGNDAPQETDYVYTGTPAWRYDTSPLVPDDKKTWSVFAGYSTVEVRVGDHNSPSSQKTTDYTFFQGMDGDRASASGGVKSVSVGGIVDAIWLAGHTREAKTLNGVGGAVVSDVLTAPWASNPTASNGTNAARFTGDADTVQTEPVSTGGTRSVHTKNSFDAATGLITQTSVEPSDATASCSTITYAPANTGAGIVGAVAEVSKVGVACASLPNAHYPADAISDVRTSYDGQAYGAAPTKGDATKVEIVDGYPAGTLASAHWATQAATAYDSMGRPTSVVDVLQHTTGTAYTPAAGAPVGSGGTTKVVTTATAPFGWTTTTTFDPARGTELSSTDQNGKVTTATYDPLGRRSSVWLPSNPKASAPNSPSISYSYLVSQTAASAVTTKTLTAGGVISTFALFDGLGQPIQTQAPAEGGGTVVTDNAYDTHGRVAFTDAAYWTPSVDPSTKLFVPTALSQVPSQTVTAYDAMDRTVKTTLNSLGAERYHTGIAYPGADRVDTTPPYGGTPTTTFTNSQGQQTSLVQYLAATPASGAQTETTTYGFNAQGKMSSMTDPAGNSWSWRFDVLGHQVGADDPDSGTTTSTYDDAGNLLSTTDARGVTVSYSYDALNRKTAQYQGTTSGSLLAAWTYDSVAKGQLASSTSYSGSVPGTPGLAYRSTVDSYDDLYNVTQNTVTIPAGAPAFGGSSFTSSSYYDVDGSILNKTLPAMGGIPEETLYYSYDSENNLTSIDGLDVYGVANYTPIGQLSQITRTGTTTLYTAFGYDPATTALLDIKDTTKTGATFTVQADRSYSRNDAGDVTAIKTTGAAGTDTQCFGYDYLHDLTQAWTPASNDCAAAPTASTIGGAAPYWTSYAIDPTTGNRTGVTHNPTNAAASATTDTYTYPAAKAPHPHAVQTVTRSAGTGATDSYGYDASGNTVTRPGQTLSWDARGKLGSVTAGGVTQSNVYDGAGNLFMQTDTTAGTTLFLGDTELRVAVGSSSATAVRTYIVAGRAVAERTTQAGKSGTALSWLSGDANASQDLEISVTGGSLQRRYFDPFGNPRGVQVGWSSTHGYLNKPVSATSGLEQLGSRAYDDALGRFVSVDQVLAPTNPQQNNGYSYSANNPITASDPSGDCYVKSGDALNFSNNCSTGHNAPVVHSIAAPGADHKHAYKGANPNHLTSKEVNTGRADGCVSVNPSSCSAVPTTPQLCGGTTAASCVPGEVDKNSWNYQNAQVLATLFGESFQQFLMGLGFVKGESPVTGLRSATAQLPKLEGTVADSFKDGEYVTVLLKAGTKIYRAGNVDQPLGHFAGLTKPTSAANAEELYHLKEWGNNAEVVKTYTVTQDVNVYYGEVKGGSGEQVLFPQANLPLKEVANEVLH